MRILEELVSRHYNDVCFLVDIDNTYVQAVNPRKAWLIVFDYEINNEIANTKIIVLLKEKIDNEVVNLCRLHKV